MNYSFKGQAEAYDQGQLGCNQGVPAPPWAGVFKQKQEAVKGERRELCRFQCLVVSSSGSKRLAWPNSKTLFEDIKVGSTELMKNSHCNCSYLETLLKGFTTLKVCVHFSLPQSINLLMPIEEHKMGLTCSATPGCGGMQICPHLYRPQELSSFYNHWQSYPLCVVQCCLLINGFLISLWLWLANQSWRSAAIYKKAISCWH